MPNRWTRNSSDTLVPKVGGTKPDGSIVAAKLADDSVEGRTVDYYKSASDVTGTGKPSKHCTWFRKITIIGYRNSTNQHWWSRYKYCRRSSRCNQR